MSRRAVGCLTVLLALAACGSHRGRDEEPDRGPIYSPNGEPLSGGPLGHPGCEAAMSAWFDRVDAGHRGMLGLDDFLSDARRQFAAMDLDHDGIVTPAALAQYRAPYGLDAAEPASPDTGAGGAQAGRREGGRIRSRGADGRDANERGPSRDRPDPVMLADVDLRNRVTLADFLTYARRNFRDIDTDHDGRLSKGEAAQSCPKP